MFLTDEIAEALEKKGLWRRAAARWLAVLDNALDEKTREAASIRRNYCSRMATGAKPDSRMGEI
ncbi:PerC family transcriptional regulator [Lelliottia wanjuensis]|uniref:PerC family transcriptional regulator n=1 Tax=Lelliottia wanjuensis TaxID=3050585 RepID=UPI00254B88EB|nr:PerC family transcriptional regulator [Lelliottia sp. V104_15]MDK9605514.1 PerC family transcriptional regulator [Lelliottia sp. V104_15]